MTTHLDSGLECKQSVSADLAALVCDGGLIVETLSEWGLPVVRSTIHLDGDLTIFVAEMIATRDSVLVLHFSELKNRIKFVSQRVKKIVWTVYSIIAVATSALSFTTLPNGLLSDVSWMTVLAWIGLNSFLFGTIVWLMQTSSVRNWLLSLIVSRLSRVGVK